MIGAQISVKAKQSLAGVYESLLYKSILFHSNPGEALSDSSWWALHHLTPMQVDFEWQQVEINCILTIWGKMRHMCLLHFNNRMSSEVTKKKHSLLPHRYIN